MENPNPELWKQLNRAVVGGDLAAVERVIEQEPDLLHFADSQGSVMHTAADFGRLEIIKFLTRTGADLSLIAELGGSLLDCAAGNGHLEVAQFLVENGVSLAVPQPNRNPLFSAIYGGHLDVVKFLLEVGMDRHVVYRMQGGYLKNALSFARSQGKTDIADFLVKAGCRMPIEGVDIPVWDQEGSEKQAEEVTGADKAHEQLILLMSDVFGPVDALALQEIVPVHDQVRVAINVIRPNESSPHLTLFTTGMSDRAMKVPAGQEAFQYAELLMHLPATWPHPRDPGATDDTFWPFQWLRQIAYMPHVNDTWLGGPLTIISSDDPPAPLGPNTKQTCLLLAAKDTPILLEGDKSVRLYTVTPIYTEEREFEKKHGIVALLQGMHDRGIGQVVDVGRENVGIEESGNQSA